MISVKLNPAKLLGFDQLANSDPGAKIGQEKVRSAKIGEQKVRAAKIGITKVRAAKIGQVKIRCA